MPDILSRRTSASIAFAGVDISAAIADHLLSISYTDNEEDETDDLQIKLQDRDDVWLLDYIGSLIDAAGRDDPETSGGAPYKVKTNGSRLNIRAARGTDSDIIGKLTPGTRVIIYDIDNDWGRVDHDGARGYVSMRWVVSDTASPRAAAQPVAKGLRIQAAFVLTGWPDDIPEMLDCGEFALDSIDAAGPPSTITLKASSLPYAEAVRKTKKSRAWEKYSLSGIAREIADTGGMGCFFDSPRDPHYDRVEQIATSDISFLSTLCHDAGLSLKAVDNTIVVFDQAVYEAKNSIFTITHGPSGGYINAKLGTGDADTDFDSCRVSYVDPETGRAIEGIAYADDYDEDDDNNQRLEISAVVRSIAEAQELAKHRLRLHNKFEKTGSFTFPGNPALCAGLTVAVSGWGTFDGKYMITRAVHKLSSSGYTTRINIRRALAPDTSVASSGTAYKVTASRLNVRSGPGTDHNVIGVLVRNDSVSVIGTSGDWSKIIYDNKDAYVYTQYIKAG